MLRATSALSSCQQWSVRPFRCHDTCPAHVTPISAVICPFPCSCCMPYSCRTHISNALSPFPFVLLVRPSHPPYNSNTVCDNTSWIYWPLKMGPIGCPETSVSYYHYTLRRNPKYRTSQLQYWSRIPFPSRATCLSILSTLLQFWCRISIPLRATYPVISSTLQLQYWSRIAFPSRATCLSISSTLLQFWCRIYIPIRATYAAISSILQLQYWSRIAFPSRATCQDLQLRFS